VPAQESPHPPPEPSRAKPAQVQAPQRRTPARRRASRLYSPGSDATTRRLVAAGKRRPRPEQQAVADREAPRRQPESSSSRKQDREKQEDTELTRERRPRRPRPLLLPVVLGIATLLLGGLAAWSGTQAHDLTSTPAAANSALADAAETATVRTQVTSAVSALFSYDYANPGPTTRAASRLLTGPATAQYASLFAQVRKDAPGQKLIVTTAVTSVGVELLTGNQARLLVFATETDQRAGGGQPASAAAMLALNAVRQGSTWKIEGIDTY
jgi:Mce-associated membrane protein